MRPFKILSLLLLITFSLLSCEKETPSDPTDPNNPTNPTDPNDPNDPTDPQDPTQDYIVLQSESSQIVSGDLSDGMILNTLDWAWSSNIACFVTPAQDWYKGNHVFYQIDLPTQSIITINLIPDDSSQSMSLYAFTKAAGSTLLPTEISSCVSCEADPNANFGSVIESRSIELNATTNPYSVMIGVAGAENGISGSFKLEVIILS